MADKVKIYTEIKAWFEADCPMREGMKLHFQYSKNARNKQKLATNVSNRKQLLKAFMSELLNIYKPEGIAEERKQQKEITPEKVFTKTFEQRLNEEFPKLKFSELPDVLKLLVYERFEAWEESKKQHKLQHDAQTDSDRFDAAKTTVLAVQKNWQIWAELDHFHKYGKVLGKHAKFEEKSFESEIKELEKLPVTEYIKELTKISARMRNNINRMLKIQKDTGNLTPEQQSILDLSILKFDTVAEKLNEPKWKK